MRAARIIHWIGRHHRRFDIDAYTRVDNSANLVHHATIIDHCFHRILITFQMTPSHLLSPRAIHVFPAKYRRHDTCRSERKEK